MPPLCALLLDKSAACNSHTTDACIHTLFFIICIVYIYVYMRNLEPVVRNKTIANIVIIWLFLRLHSLYVNGNLSACMLYVCVQFVPYQCSHLLKQSSEVVILEPGTHLANALILHNSINLLFTEDLKEKKSL